MTYEEKQAILLRAHDALERLGDLEYPKNGHNHHPEMSQWERDRPQPEPEPLVRGLDTDISAQIEEATNAARAEIAEQKEFMLAVVGEALGGLAKQLDESVQQMITQAIDALKAGIELRLDSLSAEINQLRQRIEEVAQQQQDRGLRMVK